MDHAAAVAGVDAAAGSKRVTPRSAAAVVEWTAPSKTEAWQPVYSC